MTEWLLAEGETIVLSIKPSRWFVLLASLPMLVVAGVAAGAVTLAGDLWSLPGDPRAVQGLCGLAVLVRLALAVGQWTSLQYLLTTHRMIRLRGLSRQNVFEVDLRQLRSASPAPATLAERLLRVGNVTFIGESGRALEVQWASVAGPGEICRIVNETITKARQ